MTLVLLIDSKVTALKICSIKILFNVLCVCVCVSYIAGSLLSSSDGTGGGGRARVDVVWLVLIFSLVLIFANKSRST